MQRKKKVGHPEEVAYRIDSRPLAERFASNRSALDKASS
jgi:hypothetical protein